MTQISQIEESYIIVLLRFDSAQHDVMVSGVEPFRLTRLSRRPIIREPSSKICANLWLL